MPKKPGAKVGEYHSMQCKRKGPGLLSGKIPAKGERKVPVLLVEFADNEFTVEDPSLFFKRMLNEEGFSDYGATGSVRDFFLHSSNNIFQPAFDVFGPVKLPEPIAFYGANRDNADANPAKMIVDACMLVDPSVDFSVYDSDSDGVIDYIYVYYAGYGEADGGGPTTVWPHSGWITDAYSSPVEFDGVRLDNYACSNELQKMTDLPDGIGSFCHEFGHVLGLPDLYPTQPYYAFTPGIFDVMDVGAYNNESRTPPSYSAFERYALDWIEPLELKEGEMSLRPLGDSNEAVLVPSDRDNEYFLLENRQQKGWDEYIPGHGLLVWHIDYDPKVWDENIVNINYAHQYVNIIEADAIASDGTRSGDTFPGAKNKTEFSPETSPKWKSWSGKPIPFRLYDIAESEDGLITFNVERLSLPDDPQEAGVYSTENQDSWLNVSGNTISSVNFPVDIYDATGKKVATLSGSSIVLCPGLYIALNGHQFIKFIIK